MSEITVLDGGMGKELRRIGAPFRQPEWSSLALMEAPDMVLRAHRNFVDAGAQVLITNNYAVVPYHHSDEFVAERLTELTALAGRLARQAADSVPREIRVAGSLPPLFGSYEPERFDPQRAAPLYAAIVSALDPYVDLWIGETLSHTSEMLVTTTAVAEHGSGQPIWMSFSLPDEWIADRVAIRSGETPRDIVRVAATTTRPIDALLFNCSLPEQMGPALRELRDAVGASALTLRIGGYANAFPTTRSGTYQANQVIFERREELTAQRYADEVAAWIGDGATIVGGCCDMYPEHIAALVERFT